MYPIIDIKDYKVEKGFIFETRTHILEDWIIFDHDHTGARILVRAVEDNNNKFYLDMSIMDDDDYDYTIVFNCNNRDDFLSKMHLMIDWMKDIRGQYVFYEDLLNSIPIECELK